MGEAARERVVVLGAGRVATHLVPALVGAGYWVAQIWSRTEASARALAEPLGISYTDALTAVPTDADIYIACVADAALPGVASRIVRAVDASDCQEQESPHRPLFLHTAGSVPMDIWVRLGLLAMAYCTRYKPSARSVRWICARCHSS